MALTMNDLKQAVLRRDVEIARLRAALTEIATGLDADGLKTDFPRERAQEALDGR